MSKHKQYVFTLKHSIDGGFHLRCVQCVCADLKRILPAKCDNLAWSHAWDWSYSCFNLPPGLLCTTLSRSQGCPNIW